MSLSKQKTKRLSICRREVSFAEGQAFARKNNLMFFETSAKNATNVEDAFLSTAKLILENIGRNEYDLTNEVSNLLPVREIQA